ncbi:MAG: NnrS family protein [Sphingomonadales bacterium]
MFFSYGFRPFFLGASLWPVVALVLWLLGFAGHLSLPLALDPLSWHSHEMLFGFAGAAVTGFLLTAIPSWTGRPRLHGIKLALLFGLWLAGRLALLFSAMTGAAVAAVIDVSFFAALYGPMLLRPKVVLADN